MRTVEQFKLPDGRVGDYVGPGHRPGTGVYLVEGKLVEHMTLACLPMGSAVRFGDDAKLISSVLTAERLLPFE